MLTFPGSNRQTCHVPPDDVQRDQFVFTPRKRAVGEKSFVSVLRAVLSDLAGRTMARQSRSRGGPLFAEREPSREIHRPIHRQARQLRRRGEGSGGQARQTRPERRDGRQVRPPCWLSGPSVHPELILFCEALLRLCDRGHSFSAPWLGDARPALRPRAVEFWEHARPECDRWTCEKYRACVRPRLRPGHDQPDREPAACRF